MSISIFKSFLGNSNQDIFNFDPLNHPTKFVRLKGLEYESILISGSVFNKLVRRLTFRNTTVAFLNGIDDPFQNHLDYLRLIAKKGYDVYALNLPAHGKSAAVNNLSWEILVDIVNEFFLQHNLKNITLIGYSLGGGLALKLLQTYSYKFKEIKLIAPFCYSPDTILEDLKEVLSITKFGIFLISQYKIFGKARPQLYTSNLQNISPMYVPLLLKYEFDLSSNQTPIKVILFQDDELINEKKASVVLNIVPHCSIEIIKNINHDMHFLKTDQIINIVNTLFSN
jgi:pimeloyl-ACP methyl ester carboxylesterase